MSGCQCDDPEVVPVFDKNMEPPYVEGNAYARFCLNCGVRKFCSGDYFERKDDSEKYVIPLNEEDPVPMTEFQGDVDSDDGDEDDGEQEPENEFECPKCGADHTGHPDQCDECGVEYHWDN